MMRSLFSGVSGLRNHQVRMDVIGNNIANVNTVGYKRSRVTFQDMLSQNVRGSSAPQLGRGGSNPQQIGLGVTIGSLDTIHTQGSSETTGKSTDMMVDGDGFLIVGDGTNNYYTRAGNFDFDSAGNLVNPNGMVVQGWKADSSGAIDTSQMIGGISIPKGQSIQPKATTSAKYINNLDANTAPDGVINTSLQIYDSLGNSYDIPMRFHKDPATAGLWTFEDPGQATGVWPKGIINVTVNQPNITFNTNGSYALPNPPDCQVVVDFDPLIGNTGSQTINTVDFRGMTQYTGTSNVTMSTQDGYGSGVLTGYSVDKSGVVTGTFSNGFSQQLAQVATANFNNPTGLAKNGSNLFVQTNNSGTAQIGIAGVGGRGEVTPGALEMSNVDLSQEFTDMIITQRGFQANSRIITTSDEMLQELVNLKR